MWLRSGEIVFPAAAVVVIHDFEVNRQRFFTGHDEARSPKLGENLSRGPMYVDQESNNHPASVENRGHLIGGPRT